MPRAERFEGRTGRAVAESEAWFVARDVVGFGNTGLPSGHGPVSDACLACPQLARVLVDLVAASS